MTNELIVLLEAVDALDLFKRTLQLIFDVQGKAAIVVVNSLFKCRPISSVILLHHLVETVKEHGHREAGDT